MDKGNGMSGHTQGEWIAYGDRVLGPERNIGSGGVRHTLAVVLVPCLYDTPASMAEQQANARLIAAAPDLLAACKADDANHDALYRFIRHLERALDGTHQQAVADTLLELAKKMEGLRESRSAAIAKAEATQ